MRIKQWGNKSLKMERFSTKQFLIWAVLASLGFGLMACDPPFAHPIDTFLILFCSFIVGRKEWVRPIPPPELVKMFGWIALLVAVLIAAKVLTPPAVKAFLNQINKSLNSFPWKPLIVIPIWLTYLWLGFRRWHKGRAETASVG